MYRHEMQRRGLLRECTYPLPPQVSCVHRQGCRRGFVGGGCMKGCQGADQGWYRGGRTGNRVYPRVLDCLTFFPEECGQKKTGPGSEYV